MVVSVQRGEGLNCNNPRLYWQVADLINKIHDDTGGLDFQVGVYSTVMTL
jgi:hypothetical protein